MVLAREPQESLGGARRASRLPREAPTEPRGIPNGVLVVSEGHPGGPKGAPGILWGCQKGIQASQGSRKGTPGDPRWCFGGVRMASWHSQGSPKRPLAVPEGHPGFPREPKGSPGGSQRCLGDVKRASLYSQGSPKSPLAVPEGHPGIQGTHCGQL